MRHRPVAHYGYPPTTADSGSMEVFSSGEVGPYGFYDVVGALTRWLTSSATTTTG